MHIAEFCACLGQDVSRLVDICRQCIIFRSVQDLQACISAISSDPSIVTVRAKHRMDPHEGASASSAGYRDIVLNLRLVSPRTMELGVETHVCEVQLILEFFARLKVPPHASISESVHMLLVKYWPPSVSFQCALQVS